MCTLCRVQLHVCMWASVCMCVYVCVCVCVARCESVGCIYPFVQVCPFITHAEVYTVRAMCCYITQLSNAQMLISFVSLTYL